MATKAPTMPLRRFYERMAQDYLRKLPLEHFMESTPQSKQREITLESFAIVRARRTDFQVFSELLVQYPLPRRKRPGQVVPDNMVVIHSEPIKALGSYDMPLQPAGPFWVLEYVSKSNRRKDYKDNFDKYERDLKVPYYLLFEPDKNEMTLHRHDGKKYKPVKPNEHGRCAFPELEIEVALLDGSVRFWHRGELLPLPGDLLWDLEATQRRVRELEKQLADVRAKIANGKNGARG